MQPKIENKPIYCNAWISKISDKVSCNTIPCCGFCMSPAMEAAIKKEGSFKSYDKIGLHPLCPDCGAEVKLTDSINTDRYGKLVYYNCKVCKEEFVSKDGGELAIAAP